MQTISDFDKQFGTDEQCKRFLVAARWPDGVRCQSDKVSALKARPRIEPGDSISDSNLL